VPGIAIAEVAAGVAPQETPHPEGPPLEDVGQFMGQQRCRKPDPPLHQNHGPPRLGPGPGGKEPGHDVEAYGDGGAVSPDLGHEKLGGGEGVPTPERN